MKTAFKSGSQINVTASGADLAPGTVVLEGDVVAITVNTIADGETGPANLKGHYTDQPKVNGTAAARGATAYWDDTAKEFTPTGPADAVAGIFAEAAASGDTTCEVILNL